MKKEEKKHQKWWMVVGAFLTLFLVCVGMFLLQNDSNLKGSDTTEETYEGKMYKSFVTDLGDYVDSLDSKMDYSSARTNVIHKIIELQKIYSDGTGVGSVANKLINNTMSVSYASTKDYLDAMSIDLASLIGNLFSKKDKPDKVLTMRSTTVCDGGKVVNPSRYCIDGLSGKVWITNKRSNKWVVLLHAVMLNGTQIYDALGEMYTSQGYNVLAPDLRQHGDSGGVDGIMGYLESLDVYDWIKYLNEKPSDFGVSVAPKTIIVHGVSLGGATTLQLATNPDIASKTGTTYTKTLTELNVKGFVDDCGYTSMSGIFGDMLFSGDSDLISTIAGYFNLDEVDILKSLQEEAEKLNIDSLSDIDLGKIANGQDLSKYFEKFSDAFNKISENANSQGSIGSSFGNSGQSLIPDIGQNSTSNWWNQSGTGTSATGSSKVTLVENSILSNFKENFVKQYIINIAKVGLDESNYDKYSNAFSSGRGFPSGSKVMIIHGTDDTIVNHSNADTVAANIGSADLFYKWDVEGAPHAFIIIGSEKDKYKNLVGSFTKYVETGKKNADVFSSSSIGNISGGGSSSGISGIFDKIGSFFSGLFGKK